MVYLCYWKNGRTATLKECQGDQYTVPRRWGEMPRHLFFRHWFLRKMSVLAMCGVYSAITPQTNHKGFKE